MTGSRLRFSLCLLSILSAGIPAALASNWTDPTPAELKMTSDPAAPDAPAVYLFREEIVDDTLHYHRVYARIKILTEKGKETYSDVELPYERGVSSINAIEGRTIQPDGTIVPFTGKPFDKVLVKSGDTRINEKVFSMPDVQVGSILEYRWEFRYEDNYAFPPRWDIQQPIFVHKAHYHFIPVDLSIHPMSSTDSLGHEMEANRMLYFPALPKGDTVQAGLNGYDLVVNDVPPIPEEEFSPPLDSFSYRLLFYYSPAYTGQDFWKQEMKFWSKDVDRFANPNDKIRQAVSQIVAPGDTDDQKLHKIYDAVEKLENTRFTREHSSEENHAEGLRVKTAADIWEQKRGSDDELTRLFISMARAAGLKAYGGITTERDRALINPGLLDWDQFEDEFAIVNIGGKDVYFDPGQRYCEYGKLHWMHTQLEGVRQTDHGPEPVLTPTSDYRDNEVIRSADLQMGLDGAVTGIIRVTMGGSEALRWRQQALRTDADDTKKKFEDDLQARVPPGVHISIDHFVGLTDYSSALMAVANVTGNMGTATGKHVFVPGSFFETGVKPLFAAEKRESPVDLRFPWLSHDVVTVTLAPGLSPETVPASTEVPFLPNADFKAKYTQAANSYTTDRIIGVGNTVYKTPEYPQLRDFFQKAGAQDQQQIVLTRTPVTASK